MGVPLRPFSRDEYTRETRTPRRLSGSRESQEVFSREIGLLQLELLDFESVLLGEFLHRLGLTDPMVPENIHESRDLHGTTSTR